MNVGTETINHIAKLAKLNFEKEEAEKFAAEFEHIMTHFENLDKEDLTEITLSDFEDVELTLREDKAEYYPDKEELFQNAEKMKDRCIVIPKMIE